MVGLEDEPLLLREGWDAVYQYSGRGKETVVTEGRQEWFPLCEQYIITEFIYLPLVIDPMRTIEIPEFRS